MADPCAGADYRKKQSTTDLVIYSVQSLSGLLARRGAWWAVAAIPLVGVLEFASSSFCAAGPPDDPELSAEEYAALLALSPWDTLSSALEKLATKAKIAVWYEICECHDAGAPYPTPPFPPSVVVPPEGVSTPNVYSGLCGTWTYRVAAKIHTSGHTPAVTNSDEFFKLMLPSSRTLVTVTDAGDETITQAVKIPAQWKSIDVQYDLVIEGDPTVTPTQVEGWVYKSNGTFYQALNLHYVDGSITHDGLSTPYVLGDTTNQDSMVLFAHQIGGTVAGVVDVTVTVDCGSDELGSAACRADPALMAIVSQIYQLLQLVQRQQVPFAYIHGAVHSGLTGSGQVDVDQVIGMRVELSIDGTLVGTEFGVPELLWQGGWVNWGNDDGWTAREFLSTQQYVSLPPYAGQFTTFSYNLPPGVSAELTELLREANG